MKMLRFAVLSAAASLIAASPAKPPQHLEMDMDSREYAALTAGMEEAEADDPLTAILGFGKRNLQWLDFINAARANGQKLELSTAATQVGYPIDQPTYSNREIVARDWNAFVSTLPQIVKDVVLDGKDFTTEVGMTDEQFLAVIRPLDKLYQRASRWLLQEPYLEYYAAASAEDVRGYYYLEREPDLALKLSRWSSQDDATKARLTGWLIGQCRNSGKEAADCRSEFETQVGQGLGAAAFHAAYRQKAKDHYDAFFKLGGVRTDVIWTGDQVNVATIPFKNPQRDDVLAWLRDNIEDEWKWNGWQLKLDFQDEGDENMTHVVFEAGATPHVNGIAGSEITMDGNRAIGEYSSRWTIRHEYGHVLGFPDCYLEFFDTSTNQMVQYQLDITNLMCSRRGVLQQSHFDEMKRAYFVP